MEQALTLSDILKSLLRYKWLIVTVTAVTVIIAIVSTLTTKPAYQASAKMLVTLSVSEKDFQRSNQPLEDLNNGMQITERLAKTYSEFFDARLVKAAAKDAGFSLSKREIAALESKITVKQPVLGSQLLKLTVEYRNAKQAADIANFLSKRLTGKTDDLALVTFPGSKDQPVIGLKMLSPASVPGAPVKPRLVINLMIGLILGLFPSAALALLLDRADGSIKDIDELRGVIGSVPILALIPRWPKAGNSPGENDTADSAHAILALRTRLSFLAPTTGAKTILIGGLALDDEKTAIIGRLGVSLAKAGKRTLLVDADMRRSSLTRAFDIAAGSGLAGVLHGSCDLKDAIIHVGIENLNILPAGRSTFEPGDLLATDKLAELLAEVGREYDFVLVDAPPASAAVDGSIISGFVDALVLVVRLKRTEARAIERALADPGQASTRLLGVIVYGAAPEFADYSGGHSLEDKTEIPAGAAL